MTRGPVYVAKMFGDVSSRGGSVPVAKIFLPDFSSATATPIRLIANNGNPRVAEARPRRAT
jgi:hypothetical protein